MQKMSEKEATLCLEAIKDSMRDSFTQQQAKISLDMAIAALEKQMPKKPHKYIAFDGIERNGCPHCFEERGRNEILYAGQRYCSVCGQAILREEAEAALERMKGE